MLKSTTSSSGPSAPMVMSAGTAAATAPPSGAAKIPVSSPMSKLRRARFDRHMDIAGMENLILKRGQALFWDGNTIHRGILPPGMNERLVLVGALAVTAEGLGAMLNFTSLFEVTNFG